LYSKPAKADQVRVTSNVMFVCKKTRLCKVGMVGLNQRSQDIRKASGDNWCIRGLSWHSSRRPSEGMQVPVALIDGESRRSADEVRISMSHL
jgi:hypothetical protein